MSSSRSLQTLNANEIPVTGVTVYTDQAEVTRRFRVTLKPGLNEIELGNISDSIQQYSIYVDCQGSAIIRDVKLESSGMDRFPKIKELKEKSGLLEAEAKNEQNFFEIYNQQIENLTKLFKSVGFCFRCSKVWAQKKTFHCGHSIRFYSGAGLCGNEKPHEIPRKRNGVSEQPCSGVGVNKTGENIRCIFLLVSTSLLLN